MIGTELVGLIGRSTPVLRGLPRAIRLGVVAGIAGDPLARRAWRFLTNPLVAVVLFTLDLWAWHLAPEWYDAAVKTDLLKFEFTT